MKQREMPNDVPDVHCGMFSLKLLEDEPLAKPSKSAHHSLLYLVNGKVNASIGAEQFTIQPDECLFVPSGEIFSFANSDMHQGYLCHFDDDFIIGRPGQDHFLKSLEFLSSYGNHHLFLQKASPYVHNLLSRIFDEYQSNKLHHFDLIQSYFIALLAEVNQAYEAPYRDFASEYAMLAIEFKFSLSRYIHSLHQVDEYAALLNTTPNHLKKVIKATTEKTPTQWIYDQLIMEAKALLCQTDLSTSQVEAEIGIKDQSYFNEHFKNQVGCTPTEFRNKNH